MSIHTDQEEESGMAQVKRTKQYGVCTKRWAKCLEVASRSAMLLGAAL